jgi:hypothetical protein
MLFGIAAGPQRLHFHFLPSRIRDKIVAYSMRAYPAISATPLLQRFRHGRPDRGRRPSC